MIDSSTTPAITPNMGDFGAILGAIAGALILFIIIILALVLLVVISKCKLLKKCGKRGWEAIIPYHSQFVFCETVGVNPIWVLITMFSVVLYIIPVLGSLLAYAVLIYFTVLLNVSLAKSFGKSTGFAVGLTLLPFVFYPILGFGKSEFIGANPMEDVFFKKKVDNNNSNLTTNSQPTTSDTNQNINVEATASPSIDSASNDYNSNIELTPIQEVPANDPNNNIEITSIGEVPSNESNSSIELTPIIQETQANQQVTCAKCGNQLQPTDAFCTNCGTPRN